MIDACFVTDWREAATFDKKATATIVCVIATLSIDVASPSVQFLTLTRIMKVGELYEQQVFYRTSSDKLDEL